MSHLSDYPLLQAVVDEHLTAWADHSTYEIYGSGHVLIAVACNCGHRWDVGMAPDTPSISR